MKVYHSLDHIELKCNSLVDGRDFYENDNVKWFSISDALDIMHKTQRIAFEEAKPLIENYVL
jgi:hypothetical protein